MPLRVIGGEARGVMLRLPRGETRPTGARLREALFSMLDALPADLTEVLDLYAGSGALGIEALSRGAERCTFVEANASVASTIRDNLMRARVESRARVMVANVDRWRPPAEVRYTLILADPPYDDGQAAGAIGRALDGALVPHASVVLEHAARASAPEALCGLPLWRDRRHGDGAVAIYRRSEESEPAAP